jgi:hypothetical protein
MGDLDRMEKRLQKAGFTPYRVTLKAGDYADDILMDHATRAAALKIHFDTVDFRKDPQDPHDLQNAYKAFTERIAALRVILNRSKTTTYEERITYYPGLYTALIVTNADRARLDAAHAEQDVFMETWENVLHETGDAARAARAGREAVEAWKEENAA